MNQKEPERTRKNQKEPEKTTMNQNEPGIIKLRMSHIQHGKNQWIHWIKNIPRIDLSIENLIIKYEATEMRCKKFFVVIDPLIMTLENPWQNSFVQQQFYCMIYAA